MTDVFRIVKKGNVRQIFLNGFTDIYGGTYRDSKSGKFTYYLGDMKTGSTILIGRNDFESRQDAIEMVKAELLAHRTEM